MRVKIIFILSFVPCHDTKGCHYKNIFSFKCIQIQTINLILAHFRQTTSVYLLHNTSNYNAFGRQIYNYYPPVQIAHPYGQPYHLY